MTSVHEEAIPRVAQAKATSATHPAAVYGAMPDTRAINYYESDPYLRFLLRRRLSPAEYAALEPRLVALGSRLGAEIGDLAAEADKQTPTLRVRDKRGVQVDEVQTSRAYQALQRIYYGEFGLAALPLRPGVLFADRPASLMASDAMIYLAGQGESGILCPLSMTRAMGRTLLKFAPASVVETYVPGLLATDPDALQTGAMFMTEKQGGSDLGQTATTARPSSDHPGWWELTGDKWFCSNAGADVILTLARPEGAGPGTRGLGLYLVPRILPDGSRNRYRIERLKDKLGMRSFASGEVTLNGTLALEIGGPGDGWKRMTEMLNITRLNCATAASALARRAFLEAITHARGREAYGVALADLPLLREQLLDVQMDAEALTALAFEGTAQLQAADAGDEEAQLLARVLIPLAKYHVSDDARRVVEQGMEVRGGNAYIEDWPNARMLRDVQVHALWEGTGNVSALDVERALLRKGAGEALLRNLHARLDAISDPAVVRAARLVRREVGVLGEIVTRMVGETPAQRDLRMVRLTRQLARAVTAVLFVEDAEALARQAGNYRGLVQAARYLRRYIITPRRGPADEINTLALTDFDALIDWSPSLPAATAEPLLAAMEAEA